MQLLRFREQPQMNVFSCSLLELLLLLLLLQLLLLLLPLLWLVAAACSPLS